MPRIRLPLPVFLLLLALAGLVGFVAAPSPAPGRGSPASPAPPVLRHLDSARTPAPTTGPGARATARTGEGEIMVRVTGTDGAPLAHVAVLAFPAEPSSGEGWAVSSAESGADGIAVLGGLPGGEWRLTAQLAGWAFQKSGQGTTVPTGGRAEFSGRRAWPVVVEVRGPDGRLADSAEVSARQGITTVAAAWFRDAATLWFGPGEQRLSATDGRPGGLASAERRVLVGPGYPSAPVVLALQPRAGLRGRIEFPAGDPGYPVTVYVFPAGPGTVCPPLPRDPADDAKVESAFDPEFAFPDLAPGEWLVAAVDRAGNLLDHRVVPVVDGGDPVDLSVPAALVRPALLVRVEAPDGELLQDVQLGIEVKRAAGRGGRWTSATFDVISDGRLRVVPGTVSPRTPIEELTFAVNAKSPIYGDATAPFDPRETEEVTIRFEEPAVLALCFAGLPAAPLRSLLAAVIRPEGEGGGVHEAEGRLTEAGEIELGPVPPGRYEVRVGIRHDRFRSLDAFLQLSLALDRGRTKRTVDLPAFGELRVRVGSDLASEPFELVRNSPRNSYLGLGWVSPVSGELVFPWLAAGDYLLRRRAGSEETMLVRVDGDTRVEFQASSLDALRVAILDLAGALMSAGLRDGDLIVAIDGAEIGSEEHGRALIAAARKRGPVNVTFLRGPERRQTQLDFSGTADPAVLGGALLPAARN